MNLAEAPALELTELADQAGVTTRTIRFYIQQGLLPSPGQTGPGVKYGPDYLARLQLIRRLQREHLPLAEVRKRVSGLDERGVAAALAAPQAGAASAVDYVRSVLQAMPSPSAPRSAGRPAAGPSAVASVSTGQPPRKPTRERSQWDRITLTDDVELHVRRPLSRDANRRLERLLEQARRIFEEEP